MTATPQTATPQTATPQTATPQPATSRTATPPSARSFDPTTRPTSGLPAPRFIARTDSPIGRLELTSTDDGVASLSIERAGMLPHDDLAEQRNAILDDAIEQLAEYFAGDRTDFTVPLDVVGTPFQRDIWHQLSLVGWGQALSYGELGLAAGRPGSGRAVGGAVGANPVPIFVGCHRVLASNRRLTGYSAGNGLPTKIWLLEHERIEHHA